MDGAFPAQKGQSFEPGGFGGGRGPGRDAPGFRGTAENAKTKLCTRWLQGDCRFGERCNFAHGEHELRRGPDDSAGRGGYMGRGRGDYGYGGGRGGPGRGYGGGNPGYGGGYGGHPGGYGGGGHGMDQGYGGGDHVARNTPEDVWAAQGYPTPGPNGWYMYRVKETGEAYYHNHRTNATVWERPADWPMGPPQM